MTQTGSVSGSMESGGPHPVERPKLVNLGRNYDLLLGNLRIAYKEKKRSTKNLHDPKARTGPARPRKPYMSKCFLAT